MQGHGGTTSHGSKRVLSELELDRMVDAYFDRELSIGDRRRLFDQLSGKGGRCEDIARMQRILAQLRRPPVEIDVADEVIARVAHRRSFLSPAMRSAIKVGRTAVAASILLALLGIVIVQRIAPDATGLVAESTPVTSLMKDTGSELAQIRTNLAEASEQAASVLLAQLSGVTGGDDLSLVVTVGVAEFDVRATQPVGSFPTLMQSPLVVLSGAGDRSIIGIWNDSDAFDAVLQGFAIESASLGSQGDRTVGNLATTLNLQTRMDGKGTPPVPYFIEHFQAGSLPVSFDSEVISGVLRLISRTSDAPTTSLEPNR